VRKILVLCLLSFCLSNAAKQSLAVMPCIGNFEVEGLERLRDKLEEVTREALPSADFRLIPYKDVLQEVGDEELFNACEEQGVCFGRLTAQVNADYGAWCKVNKYNGKLLWKFELYSVGEKDLIFTKEYDNYDPKNVDDMIKIMKKEVPIALREKIPGAVNVSKAYETEPYEKPDTQIAASETGWRDITRIASFSVAAISGAVAVFKHLESKSRLKELDDMKRPIDVNEKEWKKQYNEKADEVREKEKQRNIFSALSGVCIILGGVTFFF